MHPLSAPFFLLPTPLALVQTAPSSFEVVVIGFLFVLLVLSALGIVTALLGRVFQATASKIEPVVTQKQTSAATAFKSKELAAVIAAAVHSVLQQRPHRIVQVKEIR